MKEPIFILKRTGMEPTPEVIEDYGAELEGDNIAVLEFVHYQTDLVKRPAKPSDDDPHKDSRPYEWQTHRHVAFCQVWNNKDNKKTITYIDRGSIEYLMRMGYYE